MALLIVLCLQQFHSPKHIEGKSFNEGVHSIKRIDMSPINSPRGKISKTVTSINNYHLFVSFIKT